MQGPKLDLFMGGPNQCPSARTCINMWEVSSLVYLGKVPRKTEVSCVNVKGLRRTGKAVIDEGVCCDYDRPLSSASQLSYLGPVTECPHWIILKLQAVNLLDNLTIAFTYNILWSLMRYGL